MGLCFVRLQSEKGCMEITSAASMACWLLCCCVDVYHTTQHILRAYCLVWLVGEGCNTDCAMRPETMLHYSIPTDEASMRSILHHTCLGGGSTQPPACHRCMAWPVGCQGDGSTKM
eukprot:2426723-Amphidinium_carterae.3